LLTQRNILFTESPTNLNNYLVSNTYLEYASFLLSDVEYFLEYTDIPTKAAKFSHLEKRFQEIQGLINRGRDHFLSENTEFYKPFKLHFDYLNWFYDVTFKDFNDVFSMPDESGALDDETLHVITASFRFFDALQAYFPIDHNEFYIYESAKLSSQAFIDCFESGETIFSGNTKLSMEFTESALDMLERAYQSLDKATYRRQEYDALNISANPQSQDFLSFKQFQDLRKIYIASCYQENVLLKQLFYLASLNVDESTSDESLDDIGDKVELICDNIPDFAAIRNESALLMLSTSLVTAGHEIGDFEMLYPPKDFSSILQSNSYKYLNNLPVKVTH
jgi:hypothetical protein